MRTIVFLFNKEVYKDGLDRNSKFNIFRWTYDMCNKEFGEDTDAIVIRLDLTLEDDLMAFENDFNDRNSDFLKKYIIRIFTIDK